MDDGLGGEYVSMIGGKYDVLLTSMLLTNGIVKGREYRFKYRCKNVNGWGEYSDVTYIKAAVSPATPRAPRLISATETTMTLEFFKPEDTGGTEVKQFKLYINDGNDQNDPNTPVLSYTSNNLVHTLDKDDADSFLVSGKVYKFRFIAINEIGNSGMSDISAYALAGQPSAPGTPTINPSLTNANQIAVQWAPSTSTTAPGGLVQGYILYMMDPRDGIWQEIFNGELGYPTITSYIVRKDIVGGLAYRFKVKGAYKNGYTQESSEAVIYSCT